MERFGIEDGPGFLDRILGDATNTRAVCPYH